MNHPEITMIVAADEANGIGLDNALPWQLKDDLKRFREITMGHCLIMGHNTWRSLPVKPLKGRLNVVLSRSTLELPEGAVCAATPDEALEKCGCQQVFIIGGAAIYRLFMPMAQKLMITRVYGRFNADCYFPLPDGDEWKLATKSLPQTDSNSDITFVYEVYERKVK